MKDCIPRLTGLNRGGIRRVEITTASRLIRYEERRSTRSYSLLFSLPRSLSAHVACGPPRPLPLRVSCPIALSHRLLNLCGSCLPASRRTLLLPPPRRVTHSRKTRSFP